MLSALDDVFRGSDAVAEGLLTPSRLRGPDVVRLFRDVYVRAGVPITHELRCRGATLALPSGAVITGRSAATVRGVRLAWPDEDVRVLGQPLPDAVADLDAVLRVGLVKLAHLEYLATRRSDNGIVDARRAVELADPRAESVPESKMRVLLVLAGLEPVPQYWIEDATGRLARVDLAFPAQRVAVEYDGDWRDGALWARGGDRDRLNRVHAAGWDVVFVTAPLLRDPRRMVRTVRQALS